LGPRSRRRSYLPDDAVPDWQPLPKPSRGVPAVRRAIGGTSRGHPGGPPGPTVAHVRGEPASEMRADADSRSSSPGLPSGHRQPKLAEAGCSLDGRLEVRCISHAPPGTSDVRLVGRHGRGVRRGSARCSTSVAESTPSVKGADDDKHRRTLRSTGMWS
jgi:hypothetical protein